MAVRIGRTGSRIEYGVLLLVAAGVPFWGVFLMGWPQETLVALLAFVPAVGPLRTVLTYREPAELLPTLGGTARVVALYGGLLAVGLAVG